MLPKPTIEVIPAISLVGYAFPMNVLHNQTTALWEQFMPQRHQIEDRIGTEVFSVQRYPEKYFQKFNPVLFFEKWAAVAVPEGSAVPEGFQSMTIESGLYAIFEHEGAVGTLETIQYIYEKWLPRSGYKLAERPHFERLPEDYKDQGDQAYETIYIPIEPLR